VTGIDILVVGTFKPSQHTFRDITLSFFGWTGGPLPIGLRERIWAIVPALTSQGLGYMACQELRENPLFASAHISLLAPRSSPEIASVLARYGADDVMIGDLSLESVKCQIDKILLEKRVGFDRTLYRGEYKLDLQSWRATWNGQEVHIGTSEFVLFRFLMNHPGVVFSTHELIAATGRVDERSHDAMQRRISRLRAAFRAAGAPDPVTAVRGVGYRLDIDA